ncbi:MAG: hypothetical protein ACJARN_000949, partial [Arenicella sp.]
HATKTLTVFSKLNASQQAHQSSHNGILRIDPSPLANRLKPVKKGASTFYQASINMSIIFQ